LDNFSLQAELASLRRKCDAAAEREQALLHRENERALATAREATSVLATLQLEHAQQTHAIALLKAEQQVNQSMSQLAGVTSELERLHATHAELAASDASKALRIEALECQQAVLLDCYQTLEAGAGRQQHEQQLEHSVMHPAKHGAAWECQPRPAVNSQLLHSRDGGPLLCGLSKMGDDKDQLAVATIKAAKENCELQQQHASSHLGLALRCAELQHQLMQQRQHTCAARRAAAAAEEQVAGLRLLLARQQSGVGGTTSTLEERLYAACRQLTDAQQLGGELRHQLMQVKESCWLPLLSKGCR
jgi:hypothetical protein